LEGSLPVFFGCFAPLLQWTIALIADILSAGHAHYFSSPSQSPRAIGQRAGWLEASSGRGFPARRHAFGLDGLIF
jgi:hypothetical protein